MKLGVRLSGLPSVDISPQNPVYRHKMAGFIATNTQFASQIERTEPSSQSDDWLVCHKRVTESLERPVLHPVTAK